MSKINVFRGQSLTPTLSRRWWAAVCSLLNVLGIPIPVMSYDTRRNTYTNSPSVSNVGGFCDLYGDFGNSVSERTRCKVKINIRNAFLCLIQSRRIIGAWKGIQSILVEIFVYQIKVVDYFSVWNLSALQDIVNTSNIHDFSRRKCSNQVRYMIIQRGTPVSFYLAGSGLSLILMHCFKSTVLKKHLLRV